MQRRRWAMGVIAALALLAALGGAFWALAMPRLANSFGFALPGDDGLPYRIAYHGRHYATSGMCARAGWCDGQRCVCVSRQQLAGKDQWPLHQVETIATIFGSPHPVMAADTPAGMTMMVIFVPSGSCYMQYTIEGGP